MHRQAKIGPLDLNFFVLEALDFNLGATENVAVDFLFFSILGPELIVLRKTKAPLLQARDLDRT